MDGEAPFAYSRHSRRFLGPPGRIKDIVGPAARQKQLADVTARFVKLVCREESFIALHILQVAIDFLEHRPQPAALFALEQCVPTRRKQLGQERDAVGAQSPSRQKSPPLDLVYTRRRPLHLARRHVHLESLVSSTIVPRQASKQAFRFKMGQRGCCRAHNRQRAIVGTSYKVPWCIVAPPSLLDRVCKCLRLIAGFNAVGFRESCHHDGFAVRIGHGSPRPVEHQQPHPADVLDAFSGHATPHLHPPMTDSVAVAPSVRRIPRVPSCLQELLKHPADNARRLPTAVQFIHPPRILLQLWELHSVLGGHHLSLVDLHFLRFSLSLLGLSFSVLCIRLPGDRTIPLHVVLYPVHGVLPNASFPLGHPGRCFDFKRSRLDSRRRPRRGLLRRPVLLSGRVATAVCRRGRLPWGDFG
mmetsp:Transcript_23451/g.70227  ORF Transcript_23451/g.70227 Transcript_23451/m.70227 type:complete len:414 (+) Transcript_23451:303-1544(+)